MSAVAIHAENLGKEYRIGAKQQGYRTFRETLSGWTFAPVRKISGAWQRNGKSGRKKPNTIWALHDVSFSIRCGDIVGIIGRNGAGKSTLLKILARITDPSSGFADLQGRVGSLLEVGTGFHPELTGRENIFLNGAILGMGRSEINLKFDEIVAFAEVDKFIDTAVKHYSSGMYLRLAFAVAAHLEPEILLVDEVLAVGDAAFQKKCLRRMEDVAQQGRTILFVSHNMGAIRSLCNTGIVLDQGTVAEVGDVNSCIARYFRSIGAFGNDEGAGDGSDGREGFGRVWLDGDTGNTIDQGSSFTASTTLRTPPDCGGFSVYCIVEDMHGRQLIHLREESSLLNVKPSDSGRYDIHVRFPALWLNPGLYALYFKVQLWGNRASSRHLSDKFPLDVVGATSQGESILHPATEWTVE